MGKKTKISGTKNKSQRLSEGQRWSRCCHAPELQAKLPGNKCTKRKQAEWCHFLLGCYWVSCRVKILSRLPALSPQAKLLDSQGKVTKWFNNSAASLTMPTLDNIPFSLIVSQDVVKAAVAAALPPEEFMVLLDSVVNLSTRQRIGPPRPHHRNFLNTGCP